MIDLSICPTLDCNMRCPFCYIRKRDGRKLSLITLIKVLREWEIRNLDIYGGEITCLPTWYSLLMMGIVEHYHKGDIGFITNGLKVPRFWRRQFLKHDVGFSIDSSRQHQDVVKDNIRKFDALGKGYSLLTVDVGRIDTDFMSSLVNLRSISIKPYSKPIGGSDFQSRMLPTYMKLFHENPELFDKLERTQDGRDDIRHLFLMPDGKLYDIQYRDNQEYFEEYDRCVQKKDVKCLTCKYFGRCFNEHYDGYRVPKDGDCMGRREVMEFLDDIHDIH